MSCIDEGDSSAAFCDFLGYLSAQLHDPHFLELASKPNAELCREDFAHVLDGSMAIIQRLLTDRQEDSVKLHDTLHEFCHIQFHDEKSKLPAPNERLPGKKVKQLLDSVLSHVQMSEFSVPVYDEEGMRAQKKRMEEVVEAERSRAEAALQRAAEVADNFYNTTEMYYLNNLQQPLWTNRLQECIAKEKQRFDDIAFPNPKDQLSYVASGGDKLTSLLEKRRSTLLGIETKIMEVLCSKLAREQVHNDVFMVQLVEREKKKSEARMQASLLKASMSPVVSHVTVPGFRYTRMSGSARFSSALHKFAAVQQDNVVEHRDQWEGPRAT